MIRLVPLGFGCNNACIFCAQGGLRALPFELSPDSILTKLTPGDTVAFVGGEPTLSARLPELIRLAEARGAGTILVQTNGRRLAYRSYARELGATSTRLALDVSLHGSSEAMHEYHTATPGSFKQTAQGIRNARAEGMRVGVTVVVTRSNYRHLLEITQLAHALGATAVHFAPVEPRGRAAEASARIVPQPELTRPHLSKAIAEARRLGMTAQIGDAVADVDASPRFASIGIVEDAVPATDDDAPPRRLPVIGAR